MPFFVIATQNPSHQIGTFALPESQLDRFLMRIELGYPAREAELALLTAGDQRTHLAALAPRVSAEELPSIQAEVAAVRVAPALVAYVQALVEATRNSPLFEHGLSPRAGLAMIAASRAWAWLEGRQHTLPEDVQSVLAEVACHRLRLAGTGLPARPADMEALIRQTALT